MKSSTASIVFLMASMMVILEAKPMSKDEMKAAARELVLTCKTKVGASDDDVLALRDRKMPQSHEGLCMLECVFDMSGIMKNSKFSKSGMIDAFKPVLAKDETKMKNVERLAETCEKEVGDGDTDKCVTAKKVVECMVQNSESHGLTLPSS